ncbi:smg-9, nonsense mediated mRNA decay factor [Linnemannia hyalina]|uniref:Smg-9, nonsense mediated mRNA decay factor n=1 Tax=Linnemannia hyalina TaxID=64524 RepID=A0A9P7XTB9_9FUNG|nr:smg-9, nonsense mediated mRNA decay factor [Linnemannia hyalina]
MRGSSSRHSGAGGGGGGNSSGGGRGGGRGGARDRDRDNGGHSHGQNPAAAPFKLLTRVAPQDAEIIPRGGMGPAGIMAPPPGLSLQPQQTQLQQGYPNYGQPYQQYSSYPNPPPPPPPQQQQQLRGAISRHMPQPPPQAPPSFLSPPPGLGGIDGGNVGMNKGVMGGGPPGRGGAAAVSGGGGGRRERSNSIMSQASNHSSPSLLQQQQQQQQQQHSQQSESDVSDVKPRRKDRQRRNKKGQQQGSGRDDHFSSNNSSSNPNSNDGTSKQQQHQQPAPHRVIVDPNSFQRQILQPNPNSNGGIGGGRGTGELYDEDARGSEANKGNNRRQAPAGRTVYSWQGTNSNQQQQQQTQQHQQHQHQQQLQALPPHLQPRGPAGPYSMPGTRDHRSMGGGPHSAGGSLSAGGRLLPPQQVVPMPPPMGAQSVKLMNEQGKIQEGAEQWMSEHPGHFVVGILGPQGVGKSSLLSSFCPTPLASAAFPKQPPQMAAVAGYQTSGIDMYITPERMILLDTEPIFCLSNLENALRNERVADGIPIDIWLDQQALVLATFLISVCNVVLVLGKDDEPSSSRSFRLLQRVEVFMKALSASSSATQGGVPGQGTGMSGQTPDGSNGLGDWCADIVFISNKVSPMAFGPNHYRDNAAKQAQLWQHSNLQLFGSINMTTTFSRFEDSFKRAPNTTAVMTIQRRERLSQLSDDSAFMSGSESEEESSGEDLNMEPRQPLRSQEIVLDEKRAGQQLNFVMLPLDSALVPQSLSRPGSGSISKKSPSNHHQQINQAASTTQHVSSLNVVMASLSVNLNRHGILGGSSNTPDHDVYAALLQDQERWSVWTKGLRNKILSLSMRPQGGPALGPRNRPGMVSEREWLRYATRTWDTIRKADFLAEYVRAAKLSRDG